ncbi:MAG: hypothetical protein MPJ24_11005 [Pirellulaceae bacterium]|nr:hypothetical protein [Pirellulaceae bacterium]
MEPLTPPELWPPPPFEKIFSSPTGWYAKIPFVKSWARRKAYRKYEIEYLDPIANEIELQLRNRRPSKSAPWGKTDTDHIILRALAEAVSQESGIPNVCLHPKDSFLLLCHATPSDNLTPFLFYIKVREQLSIDIGWDEMRQWANNDFCVEKLVAHCSEKVKLATHNEK